MLQELEWFYRTDESELPLADLFSDLFIVCLAGFRGQRSWFPILARFSPIGLTRVSPSAFLNVILGPALSWYAASSSAQTSSTCGSFSVSE